MTNHIAHAIINIMAISEILPNGCDAVDDSGDIRHIDDLVAPDAPGTSVSDEERYADQIDFGAYFPHGDVPKAVFPITLESRYPAVDLLERGIALSALMYYFNSRNAAKGARSQQDKPDSRFNARYEEDAPDVVGAMSEKARTAGRGSKKALSTLIDAKTLAVRGLSPGQIARERAVLLDDMRATIGRPGQSTERHSLAERAMDLGRLTHRK